MNAVATTYPTLVRPAANRAMVEVNSPREHFETLIRELRVIEDIYASDEGLVFNTNTGRICVNQNALGDLLEVVWVNSHGTHLTPVFTGDAIQAYSNGDVLFNEPTILVSKDKAMREFRKAEEMVAAKRRTH